MTITIIIITTTKPSKTMYIFLSFSNGEGKT
jgi:hypothetical protein